MVTIRRKPNFKKQMYENEAWSKSELICGIDEVGRSCLAGPVVAAAVILNPNVKHRLLKDSKVLTAEERLIAYNWLQKNCIYSVGILNSRIIDKVNIYHATLIAMKRACIQLLCIAPKSPSLILVDFMPVKLERIDIPIIHFAYGESKSSSIAAASIIAKVTRDNLMIRLNNKLPGYDFINNKGYAAPIHKNNLKKTGTTILHRYSFFNGSYKYLISE